MFVTMTSRCAKRCIYSLIYSLNNNTKAIKSNMSTVASHRSEIVFPPGWTTKKIKELDYDRSLDFLRKNFFCKEILNQSVGLREDCKDLESYCVNHFSDPFTYMLVDKNDDVIGIFLTSICHKTDKIIDWSEKCEDFRFKKIMKFLYEAQKKANIFEVYPHIDRFLAAVLIAIKSDKQYQSKGYATNLLKYAITQAALEGINVFSGESTNPATAKIMEKLGSIKLYSVFYKDYKVDGEIVFKNLDPSQKFIIHALEQKINDKKSR